MQDERIEPGDETDPPVDAEPAAAVKASSDALPVYAIPVEGVDGYHYTLGEGRITVYGPDNAVVATGRHGVGGRTVGEVDGVRIPSAGEGSAGFSVLAARQHWAANSPGRRDPVWVEIVSDSDARAGFVVVVHGTVKDDPRDQRATKDAAHFLWSGKRNARVSGRAWTPAKVDENFSRLLTEFAWQGRDVVVSHAGVGPDKTPVRGGEVVRAAPERARQELVSPSSSTDEELLEAYYTAIDRSVFWSGDDVAAARVGELWTQLRDRVLSRLADVPNPIEMSDEGLAAEDSWLTSGLVGAVVVRDGGAGGMVNARREAVHAELRGREARALLVGPPPNELSDEAVTAAYNQTSRVLLGLRHDHPEYEALRERRNALRDAEDLRLARHYEDRTDVANLPLEELTSETAKLARYLSSTSVPGDPVAEARRARREAVDAEIYRRERARFPNELARATFDEGDPACWVTIDEMPGYPYGRVSVGPRGTFVARVGFNVTAGSFPSRPAAVAALVRHYDQNPKTLPQRTWGKPRAVTMPVGARVELLEWLEDRSGSTAATERQRLTEILEFVPVQQTADNPLTGKAMKVYEYHVEEGLLDELIRTGARATTALRRRAVNAEVPREDRAAAKRRIVTMRTALHGVTTVREELRAAGIHTDQRALGENRMPDARSEGYGRQEWTVGEGRGGRRAAGTRGDGEGASLVETYSTADITATDAVREIDTPADGAGFDI